MARGLDKEKNISPPKRNPFKQPIKDKKKIDEERAADAERERKAREEALAQREKALKEQAAREEFLARLIRARVMFETNDATAAQRAVEEHLAKEQEIEDYIEANYKAERDFLRSRGIVNFDQGSPAYQVITSSWPEEALRKNYSVQIEAVTDPALVSEDKRYAYSVYLASDRREREIGVGFADSEPEAKRITQELVEEKVQEAIKSLKEEEKAWQEERAAKHSEKEAELADLETKLKERRQREAFLDSTGLQYKDLLVMDGGGRRGRQDIFISEGLPLLVREDIKDIDITTVDNLDFVTYDDGAGSYGLVVFRDQKPYAVGLYYERRRLLLTTGDGNYSNPIMRIPFYVVDSDYTSEEIEERVQEKVKTQMGDEAEEPSIAEKMAARFSPKKAEELEARATRKAELENEAREEERVLARAQKKEEFLSDAIAAVKQRLADDALASVKRS